MPLDFLLERPSPIKALRAQALGGSAESLVASHYIDHGHRLLARRYRSGRGEIDLVLRAASGN